MKVHNFKQLEVWQLGREVVPVIYRLSASFPRAEQFGLTNQLRRAAVSVPANIAEGHGRRSDGSFSQFLRSAVGSLNEVETFAILGNDLGYLEQPELDSIQEKCKHLAVKISNLIATLKPLAVREDDANYGSGNGSSAFLHRSSTDPQQILNDPLPRNQ